MAVKIKLKRLGKIRAPYYRIVVADARTKRDGRAIEEIGKYHPKADPSVIEVDTERAQHWLSVGAQPTDPVRKILEITGDWQKFKGLPGSEGTLRTAEPRADRKAAFAAAVAENLADTEAKPKSRTTTRSTRTKKAEETKAEETKAEETKAEEAKKPAKAPAAEAPEAPAAEALAAEETKAEEIQAEETKAEESKKPAKAAAAKAAAAEDSEAEAAPAAETAEQTEAAADGAGEADGSS